MNDTKFVIEPDRQEVIITRDFDAPREAVFVALTDPKHLPNWWGPARYETEIERCENWSGGSWRFISRGADGSEYAFRGVHHAVDAPHRIVRTFEYEGFPGHVSLETLTLTELDGKTHYEALAVFQTVADRDAMVQSGMESGASEGMDRLNELVKTLC
jgi:uncharacterized protein YndB with AHSA1/START domain